MTANASVGQSTGFLSEIFPLTISQPNLSCFRLTPEIDREDGNRLSFRFCQKFPGLVVTWHKKDFCFWVLAKPGIQMPNGSEWQEKLAEIQEEVDELSDRFWQFQEVPPTLPVPPAVLSQMAVQVLKTTRPYPFSSPIALSSNGVEVRRDVEFWAETIEVKGVVQPALTLTIKSGFIYSNNLAEFYLNHPDRQNPEKLLIDLNVRSRDLWGYGTITKVIIKPTPEHKEKLIKKATSEISKQALRDVLSDEILVAVKFGRDRKRYEYGMKALLPCVTNETASRFRVDWGELLEAAKITPHTKRYTLLSSYRHEASEVLAGYGFQLERVPINSRQYQELFWQPPVELKKTKFLFGEGVTGIQSKILKGLSKGGVYRRHSTYFDPSDPSRPIRITALNICDLQIDSFLNLVQEHLKRYKFDSQIVKMTGSVKNLSGADARVKVERAVNQLMDAPPDIVLTFLPQSDRYADKNEGGSLYQLVYSLLIRRQIASQMIYQKTLNNPENYGDILNQVIPGILAKLGNLPFVLAESLEIADYFIGLDISREPKERLPGTVNACASIRLYDKQGQFIRYQLEDAWIQGEEIEQRVLERLLPAAELEGKTVLIYRDGRFCGQEVPHLLERAKAIGSKFILVECRKSGIPRLYNQTPPFVEAPEHGLGLLKSSYEAILVTTDVPDKMGLARPLRLTVDERGHPADIKKLLETTLKLTLLHHGALKTPRLPMPVYGAHKTAKLRLRGIYPSSMLEGDRQFWL